MEELAAQGTVLFALSELEEIIGMSDRTMLCTKVALPVRFPARI